MNNTAMVFSIRDRTANVFSAVSLDNNVATAKRNFAFAVNHNDFFQFASKDYELCHIADFDTVSGDIVPVNPIVVVCRADEVMQND